MKTAKKTILAVSMATFAAMMFSCTGTKKAGASALESAPAVQSEIENPASNEELPSETESQDGLQQTEQQAHQNNDVSVPASE